MTHIETLAPPRDETQQRRERAITPTVHEHEDSFLSEKKDDDLSLYVSEAPEIDILSYHEQHAGRLIIDPE